MIQPTHEYTTLDFSCPVVGRSVKVDRTDVVRVSRSGKHMGRAAVSTDCSDKDHCLVATRQGDGGVAYDWSKCAFLHPPGT